MHSIHKKTHNFKEIFLRIFSKILYMKAYFAGEYFFIFFLLCLVFKVPPDLLCTDNINECLYGYIKFRVTIFKKPFYDNDIYSFIFTKKKFLENIKKKSPIMLI